MQRHHRNDQDTEFPPRRDASLRNSFVRRRQMRELREKRKELFHNIHKSHYEEQNELRKQMRDLETSMDALHRRHHRNPFESSGDFARYYKRIHHTRLGFILVNILLWTLLFLLSGPVTGLRVVIIVLAAITTVTNVFELLFMLGIKNRILNPVDNLTKGVAEIMKGNYTVVVDANAHSEVTELTEAFNDMARKLYDDEKLKEEYEQNRKLLVANISHDLKTPITSIQGYIEAINSQNGLEPEKLEKYLTIIRSNALYMNRLIDDLFLFAKLDMQKLEFDFSEVEMRRYMGDLMEEFHLELAERQATLNYTDELQADSTARVDPKRFHQVVRNIIGNAVKYGPPDGLVINTRLYAQGGGLCLDISNNGPGIPAEQLGRVFERFYRVDAERTKDTESTGLGLAIAKELITAHGGTITVTSAENQETCFTITLPGIQTGKEDENEKHIDH